MTLVTNKLLETLQTKLQQMESGKIFPHHYLEDQTAEMEKLRRQIKLLQENKFVHLGHFFFSPWRQSRMEVSPPKSSLTFASIAEEVLRT